MTVEEYFVDQLFQRGLFEDKAKQIVEAVKNDQVNESMQGRWDDHMDDYPEPLLVVLWLNVKDHALLWIEENVPNAWYKPLFES